MCTSIFTETEDKKHFLARTIDFSFPLDGNPIFYLKITVGIFQMVRR